MQLHFMYVCPKDTYVIMLLNRVKSVHKRKYVKLVLYVDAPHVNITIPLSVSHNPHNRQHARRFSKLVFNIV